MRLSTRFIFFTKARAEVMFQRGLLFDYRSLRCGNLARTSIKDLANRISKYERNSRISRHIWKNIDD